MRRDRRHPVSSALAWVGNGAFLAVVGSYLFGYFSAVDGHFEEGADILVGRDFAVFWSAAVLTAGGHVSQLYDPGAFRAALGDLFAYDALYYTWTHPPHALLVVLPLAALPYLWALAAWSLAGVAAYLVVIRKPAVLCAPSTAWCLFFGQTGLLAGAALLGALALLRRHPVLAGVGIGLISVKPHLGVLIPVALVAARAWRTFASAALTVLGGMSLSVLAFGWEAWRVWLLDALPHQASLLAGFHSWTMVSAFSGARIAGWPTWAAWLAQAPFSLLAVLATWWAFSRLRRGLVSETSAFGVLLLATAIATPYLFVYDLALVSPVVLWALASWRRRAERLRDLGECALWLVVWTLPILGMMIGSGFVPVYSVVLLAALLLSLRHAARNGEFARDGKQGR